MSITRYITFLVCPECREGIFNCTFNPEPFIFPPEQITENFDLFCPNCKEDINAFFICLPIVGREHKEKIHVEYMNRKISAFSKDNRREEVIEILAYLRLEEHMPEIELLEASSFGYYFLDTVSGHILVESLPQLEENGTKNWNIPEWFLIDIFPAYDIKGKKRKELKFPISKSTILPAPSEYNFKGFCYLARIENILRRFIIDVLEKKYKEENGENWWEAIIPQDIKDHINDIKEKEIKNPFRKDNLHPIFFTTFSQLGTIIRKRWADFEELLPDQQSVLGYLRNLEYLRNAIAHNRPIDKGDFNHIETEGAKIYEWFAKYYS